MIEIILIGLSLGSILLLIALGLAITYGAMGVINMAHGDLVMVGAYTTVMSGIWLQVVFLGSIPIALEVTALIGLAIDKMIVRHLYGRLLDTLLATWGVAILLQQAVRLEFGASFFGRHIEGLGSGLQKVDVPAWMTGSIAVFGVDVNVNRAIIIVIALLLTALTWFIMYRLPIGTQVRAIMRNPKMAAACGIDVERVNALTFAYGSGLAGVAGVMFSGFKRVFHDMGTHLVFDGVLVGVVGGIGRLIGTLAASGLLGQINGFVAAGTNDILARAVVFGVVILIIVFKPKGLFSFKGR